MMVLALCPSGCATAEVRAVEVGDGLQVACECGWVMSHNGEYEAFDTPEEAAEAWNNRTANLRKAVEEMMNSYRKEAKERKNDAYWRGAADACGNILDLPEMKEQQ